MHRNIRVYIVLTSASGFEIGATVTELEARMVAVARLVRRILDDGVDGRLLDNARRVTARTAKLSFEAASRVGGADQSQENGRGGTDGCYGSGTTPHDASSSARQESRYVSRGTDYDATR